MPEMRTHPTAEALARFGHGKLSESEAAPVSAHLETCADCRGALARLAPDSFLAKFRDARPGRPSVPSRPTVTRSDLPGQTTTAPGPSPDVPPELTDHPKFRVLRELGRGGMGVIYLAEHRVLEKPVALKVIHPAVLDHPDALARFLGEAKAAGKLDHPNIARALDADRVGDVHFMVLELVEGVSLAHVLERKGLLPVAHACHYVRQAALGLQHAFEQGMVHRDIKPQNLMLTPKGQVKVLDFGLARLRSAGAQSTRLTQFDAFMGTPEYVAPEQASDARSADTRADVYSLGCTLYALLTGRPPFQAESIIKLVLAHMEQVPRPLHEVRPDVPAELSAVVGKMLAKAPADRYQRPVEVAQALAPFIRSGAKADRVTKWQGDKVTEDPVTLSPCHLVTLSSWWLLAGAGVVVLALAVGAWLLAGAVSRPPIAATGRDVVPVAPPRNPADMWFAVGTRWEGKLMGTGQAREASVWFTVRSREGNQFTGRFVGDSRVALTIEGTLADDGASFRFDRVRQVPNAWWPEPRDYERFEASGRYTAEAVHLDFKWPQADGRLAEGRCEYAGRTDGPHDEDAWPPPLLPRRATVSGPGKWSVRGDELVQEEVIWDTSNNPGIQIGDFGWKDYDFHLKAMKTAGENGFIVVFDRLPRAKQVQWCIGLIGNRHTYVETWEYLPTGQRLSLLTERKPARVADNRWYDILIRTRGQWVECVLDGKSVFKIAHPDRYGGKIGFTCVRLAARFKDLEVRAPDGKVLWQGPPELP
jgi:serine/threonine protein kinase